MIQKAASKEELKMSFKKPGELFLETAYGNDRKLV